MVVEAGVFSEDLCIKASWKLIIIMQLAGEIIPAGFSAWIDGDTLPGVGGGKFLCGFAKKSISILGTWIHTESTILPDGLYIGMPNGVLAGFINDPASIFKNSIGDGIKAYGGIRLNPNMKIAPDALLKLMIRTLPKQKEL
jgi:hypothetical protein